MKIAIEAHKVSNPTQMNSEGWESEAQKNQAIKVIREFNEDKQGKSDVDSSEIFDVDMKGTPSMFDLFQKNNENLLYN